MKWTGIMYYYIQNLQEKVRCLDISTESQTTGH